MDRAQDWIVACAILHNFLVEQNELIDPTVCRDDLTMDNGDIAIPPLQDTGELDKGERFWRERMVEGLQHGRSDRGILYHNALYNPYNLRLPRTQLME